MHIKAITVAAIKAATQGIIIAIIPPVDNPVLLFFGKKFCPSLDDVLELDIVELDIVELDIVELDIVVLSVVLLIGAVTRLTLPSTLLYFSGIVPLRVFSIKRDKESESLYRISPVISSLPSIVYPSPPLPIKSEMQALYILFKLISSPFIFILDTLLSPVTDSNSPSSLNLIVLLIFGLKSKVIPET